MLFANSFAPTQISTNPQMPIDQQLAIRLGHEGNGVSCEGIAQ